MIDLALSDKESCAPLVQVFQGKTFDKPPCWLMRQAGRYLPEYRQVRSKHEKFTSLLFSVNDVVEVTLQPLKRFELDAAILFSDILVVPHMLGMQVEIIESKGPQLSALQEPSEILNLEKSYNPNLCHPIYESVQKIRARLEPSKALIGFAGGPWTVASYMIEGQTSKTFTKIKNFAYKWPHEFQQLLYFLADITADHLSNQIKNGVNVVKIFDSWAGSVPFSYFKEWICDPHRRILEKVRKEHPDALFISFPKGANESAYLEYIHQVNTDCLAFDSQLSPAWVAKNLQAIKVVQGGIDPSLLVTGGQPLIQEIHSYLDQFSKAPYIFNLGHGVLPETPIENVYLMLKTIEEYKK